MGVVDDARVQAQLERIIASAQFGSEAKNSSKFLKFVVEETLAGRGASLKERTIGVGAFGKAPDYDTQVYTIVRSEAQRVREKLRDYYLSSGQDDEVLIHIAKGSYLPEFSLRSRESRQGKDSHEAPKRPRRLVSAFNWLIGSSTPRYPKRAFWIRTAGVSVTAVILVGLIILIVESRSRIRDDRLVVGLAEFSPPSARAQRLRDKIKLALERREGGGPRLDVELLPGPLHSSATGLVKRARELSGNRVHVVITADSVEPGVFIPHLVMVNPFGGLSSGIVLGDDVPLKIELTDDEDRSYRKAVTPFSDLLKTLYAYRYLYSREYEKMDVVLEDIQDERLRSTLSPHLLLSSAELARPTLAIPRIRHALTMLNAKIQSASSRSNEGSTDDQLYDAATDLVARSDAYWRLSILEPPDRTRDLFMALQDNESAKVVFEKRNKGRVLILREEGAMLRAALANSFRELSREQSDWWNSEVKVTPDSLYRSAVQEYKDVLKEATTYELLDPGEESLLRVEIAEGLVEIAGHMSRVDDKTPELLSEALNQLTLGLRRCSNETPPSRVWTWPVLFRAFQTNWRPADCPVDDATWARIKRAQASVYSVMEVRTPVFGVSSPYSQKAIDAFQACVVGYSETRYPDLRAACKADLANALIGVTDGPISGTLKLEYLRRAVTEIQDSLLVFSRVEHPTRWVYSKAELAEAEARLAKLLIDPAKNQEHAVRACTSVNDVRASFGIDKYWETHYPSIELVEICREALKRSP